MNSFECFLCVNISPLDVKVDGWKKGGDYEEDSKKFMPHTEKTYFYMCPTGSASDLRRWHGLMLNYSTWNDIESGTV